MSIKIDTVSKIICTYHNIDFSELVYKTRNREIVQVRQQAMYFSRIYTKLSLKDVGNYYGGKDHGTCLHALKAINNLIDTDRLFKIECQHIDKLINQVIKPNSKTSHFKTRQKRSEYYRTNLNRKL